MHIYTYEYMHTILPDEYLRETPHVFPWCGAGGWGRSIKTKIAFTTKIKNLKLQILNGKK